MIFHVRIWLFVVYQELCFVQFYMNLPTAEDVQTQSQKKLAGMSMA